MKSLKTLLWIAILGSWLTSCGSSSEKQSPEQNNLPAVKVKVQKAGLSEGTQQHAFTGKVVADDFAQLSTRVMGQITYLAVKEGDAVSAGQVLVQIKSADIQATISRVEAGIREAEAGLKNIKINYDRIKNLYEKKSATRKELDDITAQYEMGKAQVEAARQARLEAQEMLSYAVITAPFSGSVIKKYASKGSLASPGQPILEIEGRGNLKVVAKVPESEINLFKIGDEVNLHVEAVQEKSIKGRVSQINQSAGQTQGQFEVNIQIQATPEANKALKSGMFAQVILQKGKSEGLTIAENLLVQRGQLTGLFTVNQQQQAMLRWIRTGRNIGGQVEVLSGLAPGEVYITQYEGKLTDGQKVQVAP